MLITYLKYILESQIILNNGTIIFIREIIGNILGLASAIGGMQRRVWAWPIGIVGNILLCTLFIGDIFGNHNTANLLGQMSKHIMFISISVYGWIKWHKSKKQRRLLSKYSKNNFKIAIQPNWASNQSRCILLSISIFGTLTLSYLFFLAGSYEPVWADAWIFVGSLLATYSMAKGWVEFWIIWIIVDLVGIPFLISAQYFISAFLYFIYTLIASIGLILWLRAKNKIK